MQGRCKIKLDGDKLLADLDDAIKTLNEAMDENNYGEVMCVNEAIKEIKRCIINGDYTIKED